MMQTIIRMSLVVRILYSLCFYVVFSLYYCYVTVTDSCMHVIFLTKITYTIFIFIRTETATVMMAKETMICCALFTDRFVFADWTEDRIPTATCNGSRPDLRRAENTSHTCRQVVWPSCRVYSRQPAEKQRLNLIVTTTPPRRLGLCICKHFSTLVSFVLLLNFI